MCLVLEACVHLTFNNSAQISWQFFPEAENLLVVYFCTLMIFPKFLTGTESCESVAWNACMKAWSFSYVGGTAHTNDSEVHILKGHPATLKYIWWTLGGKGKELKPTQTFVCAFAAFQRTANPCKMSDWSHLTQLKENLFKSKFENCSSKVILKWTLHLLGSLEMHLPDLKYQLNVSIQQFSVT